MTEQKLVSFHQRGGLWHAFLGVHKVGAASETGKWMSVLDGDDGWRRSAGDLEGAKAAILEHVGQWYDAAHQPLKPGQAERLCEMPRPRVKEEIKIRDIEPQMLALRIKRDGVVTTYVLPPVVDAVAAPQVTLPQARMYCVSEHEISENMLRAAPRDRLSEHKLGVFAGLLRLIDACSSSDIIRAELRRLAVERAAAERAARIAAGPDGEADVEGAPA